MLNQLISPRTHSEVVTLHYLPINGTHYLEQQSGAPDNCILARHIINKYPGARDNSMQTSRPMPQARASTLDLGNMYGYPQLNHSRVWSQKDNQWTNVSPFHRVSTPQIKLRVTAPLPSLFGYIHVYGQLCTAAQAWLILGYSSPW